MDSKAECDQLNLAHERKKGASARLVITIISIKLPLWEFAIQISKFCGLIRADTLRSQLYPINCYCIQINRPVAKQ